MDRYWLLTSTTYGTWLPGDSRGFVSNVADETGGGVRHNERGAPCDANLPALRTYMRRQLIGSPIFLNEEQAEVTLSQFQETATYRGRLLLAVGVMANHFHLLVGVPGDPDPDALLGDFKSYASRALNRRYGKPASGTWWTESGSKRKKAGPAILAAVDYIRRQYRPLVIWVNEEAVRILASGGASAPCCGRRTGG
jgi:REP element-mobilizing transposase RayT